MSWTVDGVTRVYVCECGHPIIIFYAVNYKEFACFKCGATYQILGRDNKIASKKLLRQETKSIELKVKLYDDLGGDTISEEQFKEWVKAQ